MSSIKFNFLYLLQLGYESSVFDLVMLRNYIA
jgi:hypothetical protein